MTTHILKGKFAKFNVITLTLIAWLSSTVKRRIFITTYTKHCTYGKCMFGFNGFSFLLSSAFASLLIAITIRVSLSKWSSFFISLQVIFSNNSAHIFYFYCTIYPFTTASLMLQFSFLHRSFKIMVMWFRISFHPRKLGTLA